MSPFQHKLPVTLARREISLRAGGSEGEISGPNSTRARRAPPPTSSIVRFRAEIPKYGQLSPRGDPRGFSYERVPLPSANLGAIPPRHPQHPTPRLLTPWTSAFALHHFSVSGYGG